MTQRAFETSGSLEVEVWELARAVAEERMAVEEACARLVRRSSQDDGRSLSPEGFRVALTLLRARHDPVAGAELRWYVEEARAAVA